MFSLTYIVRCVVSCLAAPPKGFAFGWLQQAAGALIIILGPKQWKLKFEPKELTTSPSTQQRHSTDHFTAQGNNYTTYSVARKWTVTVHQQGALPLSPILRVLASTPRYASSLKLPNSIHFQCKGHISILYWDDGKHSPLNIILEQFVGGGDYRLSMAASCAAIDCTFRSSLAAHAEIAGGTPGGENTKAFTWLRLVRCW